MSNADLTRLLGGFQAVQDVDTILVDEYLNGGLLSRRDVFLVPDVI